MLCVEEMTFQKFRLAHFPETHTSVCQQNSQVLFWVSLGMLEGGERSESPCSRGYLGCAEITPLFPLPYEEDPGEATLKN